MDCSEAIKTRRSIREYSSRPVSQEHLDRVLEAARLAPSATNRQPWRFVLLTDPEIKKSLSGAVPQRFVLEAPALFVCCLDRRAYTGNMVRKRMDELVQAGAISRESAGYIYNRKMPENASEVALPAAAYIDLGIAVQNMVIQATALGLGSCWVRLFNPQQFHEILKLPPEIEVVALLPLGYPEQSPPPRPRLRREDIMLEIGL